MNRLEQQFRGRPTAHERLFIMSVHSHWCPCQRIKLKMPINTHECTRPCVFPRARFTAVSFSSLTLQSRRFVARNTNSSRSQKHRLGRRCQGSSTGFARAIIFSIASDQISPTWRLKQGSTSSSTLLAVKTRILRKSSGVSPYCLSRFSHSIFSLSLLSSFRKYHFLRRLSFSRFSFSFSLSPSSSTIRDCSSGCNLGQSRRINSRRSLPSSSFTYPVSRSAKIAASKLTAGPGGP